MKFKFPDSRIVILCKAPIAGTVKTRLVPPLTDDEAMRFHTELAVRVISMTQASNLAPVRLWGSPDLNHPFFSEISDPKVTETRIQAGGDLGERMHFAITHALAEPDVKSAILIGTDCVNLDEAYLSSALEALNHSEACLGPAEDGGYGLIGLKQAEPQVFAGMEWGSDSVCAETARAMNICFDHWQLLSLLWDVDRPEDLERYNAQASETKHAGSCLPTTTELSYRQVVSQKG
ncbi:MAG: rSAM/selenodomain-associated transferase 1 [Candidatus Azotimanducaceae bacterium]|jgi:rSAM/selenodomain-associated transferase 1